MPLHCSRRRIRTFLTGREAVLSLQRQGGRQANGSAADFCGPDDAGGRERALRVLRAPSFPARAITSSGTIRRSGIAKFRSSRAFEYAQVYPGIDLVYYGSRDNWNTTSRLLQAPIRRPFSWALRERSVKLESGDLVLATAAGDVRLEAPRVYQAEGRPQSGRRTNLRCWPRSRGVRDRRL